ncbi:PDZ domain-containing protein [Sphingomonas hankookensis]|uniref:PDZ domain-containing protein n=1 Tax=Sphingomonas hankookensis TaxID=563996 RepID=UPI001F5A70B4|nr:PDZ domain-containing protein [Sphingomonas hankookensis]
MADEFFAVTPTGATEMLFAEPPTEVIGKLSAKCIDASWSVTSSTSTEVVCEAPMNFGQSLMGTLLMGNSYSTPPRRFFKYTVSTVAGVSRVQASGWMELQMAFGQMKRTDFSGPQFHNGAMNFMSAAGGKLPKGTTFPNHAFLGVGLEPVRSGKTSSMRITSLQDGSAAAQAGVQVGDQITSIAGKRFKDGDDFQDSLAKAAKTPTYGMDVLHDGKPLKLTVTRAYRQAYAEEVVAVAATPVAVTMANASELSVADELTKLGKLKADGLITQAEFDQQKVKLLAR